MSAPLPTLAAAWVRTKPAHDLTIRQIAVLNVVCVDDSPHRVRWIAEKLNLSKPVVTRALTKLHTLGLVAKERDPHDGRDILVHETDAGLALRSSMSRVVV